MGDTFFQSPDLACSTVTWNGDDLPTTWISATHLLAAVGADRLTTAGHQAVRVRNGNTTGFQALSIAVEFVVTAPSPGAPTITGVNPTSATAGGADLGITVDGSDFVGGAVVYWNSTALTTSFVSTTRLTATVPASLTASPGTANITVHNGSGLGAPVSAPWAYTVGPATPGTPVVTSLSPTTATVGAAAFPLTVNGSGFTAAAVVIWANGGTSTVLSTTFVSATQLTAQVPASLIAGAGTATITVRNGAGGAPVSGPLSLSITSGGGGAFALTSLEPTQVWAGYMGPGLLLTVNGSGFVSGAHIWIGTVEKTATAFISPTRLTTLLLPAELASVGTLQVSVKNPPAVASPSLAAAGRGHGDHRPYGDRRRCRLRLAQQPSGTHVHGRRLVSWVRRRCSTAVRRPSAGLTGPRTPCPPRRKD